jgi:hypothetical protein
MPFVYWGRGEGQGKESLGGGREGKKKEKSLLQCPNGVDFSIFVFLKKYRLYITKKGSIHSSFFLAWHQKFPGKNG